MFVFAGCLAASGQATLHGTAVNGTNKKPVSGDDVVLVRLDKGMDEEARTKTNAHGEFTFQLADTQVMRAVRVRHKNVNYFQPVLPGSTTVGVTVYESAPTVPGVHQNARSVIFEAEGNTLRVFEVFDVLNESQPPITQPEFSFYLPDGATVEGGQAARQGGMALKVAPFPQGNNKYAVAYPLLPGQTHLEVIYKVPYTGSFQYQPRLIGPLKGFIVVTPKSMGFSAASSSQYQIADPQTISPDFAGMDVHTASDPSNEKQLAFTVSGEGAIPQQPAQQAGGGQPAEDNRPGIGLGPPNQRPNPLSSGQWGFLGVLTLFMAGGAAFLYITANSSKVAVAAQPKSHSTSLLDALKEEMFQLEADRIHGKVGTDEYNSAKAALDKTLQRAMKRK